MCDQADPKLVYFDARGVVEPTRLLLAAAGVKYEDKRYAVDMTTKPPVLALACALAPPARACTYLLRPLDGCGDAPR